eukprot:6075653-Pyramimonas_sp.AAC.1
MCPWIRQEIPSGASQYPVVDPSPACVFWLRALVLRKVIPKMLPDDPHRGRCAPPNDAKLSGASG